MANRARGPYKQYEIDTTIRIPKSTLCDRRKRRIAEVDNAENDCPNRPIDEVEIESDNGYVHFQDQNDVPDSDSAESQPENEESVNDEEAIPDKGGQRNIPLYAGASVTTKQCLLLILSYMVRHSLTKEALADLLLLLNVLLPHVIPTTLYKFFKAVGAGNIETQIHFYCPSCLFYLGKDVTEGHCESCQQRFSAKECEENGNYFLYLPLEDQLKGLLSDEKLSMYLTNRNIPTVGRSSVISDVTSARLYQELVDNHNLSNNDLTLTWNTDGIPVFESSRYSIWPIQSSVNELPPHLRGKHVLLNGLWFGNQKPAMNTFLKPFVEDCKNLETNGFLNQDELQPRKVYAMVLSADSPARAIVKNCKQFNGDSGCDWCEFPGETIANAHPPTRYYPYRGPPKKRTKRKQMRYTLQSIEENVVVKGVKGPSVIGILPTFNPVRGVAVDYMHCVCLGVMRQFLNLWMDSKQNDQLYYIGRREAEIDERLLAINAPSEISRAPRSITDRPHWKASEWRAFIFYSLVVLHGILPHVFLKHLFLFVYGVYCLLGDSIDEHTISSAEVSLTKFVIETEELYGLKRCSFNVHQLVHLAQSVRDCGPLWSSSTFVFESNNHLLHKMFHGTQHVPKQIVETFRRGRKIAELSKECIDGETSPAVISMYRKLGGERSIGNEEILLEGVRGIGKECPVEITASQVLAIERLLDLTLTKRCGFIYSRFVANHQLYSTIDYVRSKKHVNCNVFVEHDQFMYGRIIGLLSIKPECTCNLVELQYCDCKSYSIVLIQPLAVCARPLFKDADFGVKSNFLVEVEQAGMQMAIHPEQIKRKCISLTLGVKEYFCPLPFHINDN
ncbi:uncharacterized protein LOC114543472 [Dendronephthya gigantea]|uniref:uncharacterized protein LOC114543472 n=1 Tax=Dendronephthya gigantea TaxID=151771 RepID=UPI00106D47A5|nr:uncharacterized protein LOC114543472 [Dendronephthya gigantea]